MAMTLEEKADSGILLTAADIQALLKNPNSWIAKLYAECLAIADIKEVAFIRYVETIMREEQAYARAEAADEKFAEARVEARKQLLMNAKLPAKNIAENAANSQKANIRLATLQVILQDQMQTLVATSQINMTAKELEDHHQKLTANLSNQLSAQLGTTVALDNGQTLNVPQLSFKPAPSLAQVLTHNPGLANVVLADTNPGMQNEFKNVFAQGELIRLAIRKAQEIREANPDAEMTVKDRIKLQASTDQNLHNMLDFNGQTKRYNHPMAVKLSENAELSMKRYVENLNMITPVQDLSASVSKPPALFSPYPGSGTSPKLTPQSRKKANEEIKWNSQTPPLKNK